MHVIRSCETSSSGWSNVVKIVFVIIKVSFALAY